MKDDGLGGFWSMVIPHFSTIASGTVEAATPILVLLIWIFGAVAVGYGLWHAVRALQAVKAALRLVSDLDEANLWQRRGQVLEASRACGAPAVAEAWREFDETLVSEDQKVFNTVNADEFFNEHRFANSLVNNRLLHAAPTALTTLGLLGTFLGLTVGLNGLDLSASTDQLRSGIQVLVQGATLGFTASLWGVAMSLVVNVSVRLMENVVLKRVRGLQARIDGLFPMRSPEQSLSDIAAHTGASNEALQVLHEKIGSALQESVTRVGEDTSRALNEAIVSSLAPIMSDLATKAADQSADVFKEVSGELTKSFNAIGVSLAEELKASSDSMRQTLDYMSSQLARQADLHLQQMATMQEAAVRQMTAVNEATERQIHMLDQSLPRIVSGLDRAAALIGGATDGMDDVVAGLARVTSELEDTSTTLAGLLSDAIGTMGDLADRTSAAAGQLASQQSSATELASKAVAAAEQLRLASGTFREGFGGMQAAQDAFLGSLEQRLGKHSQAMAGWLAQYADEVSKQTSHRMDEWNQHTERFTSTMLSATNALSEAIDELSDRSIQEDGDEAA